MKWLPLVVVGLFLLLVLLAPVHGQVSFVQPLTFPGCGSQGPLFVRDFNGDGKLDLLCSSGVLDLGNGDGTFRAGTPIAGGALAVADFNGDGKPDLLQVGTTTISVLLGNGDGTFQSPISTTTSVKGFGFSPVAAADLNGDNVADVLGVAGQNLYVFIGNGDGTFKTAVPYNLGTFDTSGHFSVEDLNGDGKLDVVLNGNGQEIVLLGNGDGTLQPPKISTGIPNGAFSAIGDFNADGKLDLAISDGNCPPCNVYVALGNGDGTFQTPAVVFSNGGGFAAADVNGDGKLDLIFAAGLSDQSQGTVTQIYLGNGDGTFSGPRSYVASFPCCGNYVDGAVVFADFNGDGKLDIASSGGILLGNGDGTFQAIPLTTLSLPPVSLSLVVGDFEKNGKPDAAVLTSSQNGVVTSNLNILHNDGSGVLSLLHSYSLSPGQLLPGHLLVGDLNGDGNLDLIVVGSPGGGCSVFLGNGDGSFQSPLLSQNGADFGTAVLTDVNNDKKLDLVGISETFVGVSLGNGDGTFAATATYAAFPWDYVLMTGDFNGDGNVDIAYPYGLKGPNATAILYGNGDGTFQPGIFLADLNNFAAFAAADFRNSGRTDLFSGYQVALNNGDGTFTVLLPLKIPPFTGFPVPDLNGDGKADILISNTRVGQGGCQTAAALGNGDGTFGSVINVPPSGCYPFSLPYYATPDNDHYPVVDMNGDGLADIVFLWGPGVGVLLNTTQPDFELSANPPTSQTLAAGQTATFNLALAPTGSFTGTVNLNCAISPAVTWAPTCTLSSESIQITGKSVQNITLEVGTAAPVTVGTAFPRPTFTFGPMPGIWIVMLLGSAWLCVRKRRYLPVFAAPTVLLALAFSVGCGGGGSSSSTHTTGGTPAGTYTATITATSGTTLHNVALQVIVH